MTTINRARFARALPPALILAAALVLVACGGGGDVTQQTVQSLGGNTGTTGTTQTGPVAVQNFVIAPIASTAPQATQDAKKFALAAQQTSTGPASPYGAASADDATKQLLDYAEKSVYSGYFPSSQPTQTFQAYRYRYYPETGVYLGVADGTNGTVEAGVYVMGGPFGTTPTYVGALTSYITPYAVLHYTDKVYALWTDKYPYAVTRSGVTKVKNMTQWNGLGKDLFLCFIANHPLADGKILTLCKDLAGMKWHTLYIDPTKEEMYEYAGTVPADLVYTVDPDSGIPATSLGSSWLDVDKPTAAHPQWNSFAKVTDGYYFVEAFSSGGTLKFIGNDGAVSIIADKNPLINGNGTIRVMWSYNN